MSRDYAIIPPENILLSIWHNRKDEKKVLKKKRWTCKHIIHIKHDLLRKENHFINKTWKVEDKETIWEINRKRKKEKQSKAKNKKKI